MATKEDKAKLLGKIRIQQRERRIGSLQNFGEKKRSHDWHSEFIYTGNLGSLYKNAGHWAVSHCKRCGYPYITFKTYPLSCEEVLLRQGKIKDCSTNEEECSAPGANELTGLKG